MKKTLSVLLVACLLVAPLAGWGEGRSYDFQFRSMDLRKVVLTISQLAGRSVQFSQSVRSHPIDVSLKNVSPEFALRLVLESYGYVSLLKGNVYHVMTAAERGPAASPMVVIPLKNTLVTDIEDNVKTFLGSAGAISTNKTMNAIVVSAPDDVIVRVRRVIEQLDQESMQVFIEAKIVETSTTFSRSLGIEWGPNLVNRPPVNGVSFSSPGNDDTIRAGMTAGVGSLGTLSARLTAGERNGEVKVISQPKITTLSGVAANLSSNLTFNIRTLAGTGAGASQVGAIQAVRAGLTLNVTPFIMSDDKVRLAIQVQKSDPDFSAKIDGIPGISDKSASTSLIVGSGQVASIGGLISSNDSTTVQGIPFFTKIPIIGALFGNNEREKKDTELMIFLAPSVYRGNARAAVFQSENDGVVTDDHAKKSGAEGAVGAAPGAKPALATPALPLPAGAPASGPLAPAPAADIKAVPLQKELGSPAEPKPAVAPKEGSLLPTLTIPDFVRDGKIPPAAPAAGTLLSLPSDKDKALLPPGSPVLPAPSAAKAPEPPAAAAGLSLPPVTAPAGTPAKNGTTSLILPPVTKGPGGNDTAALDALLGPIEAPPVASPAPNGPAAAPAKAPPQ